MFLALNEIKKEKARFILIIGIVVLISYLVFFLSGLAYGLAKDNTTAVDNCRAKKIVLKSGTNSNISSSMMDKTAIDDFKDNDISPINLSRSVAYRNGDKDNKNTLNLVLIGLEKKSKAYPKVIEGEEPKNKNQVLASITLKEENNIKLGDKLVLSMNEREFEVVGFVEESKYNVSSVIYTDLYEASFPMISYKENSDWKNSDQTNENKIKGNKKDYKTDSFSSATKNIPERISGILLHDDSDIKSDEGYDVLTISSFIKEIPGYLAQVLTFGLMIGFLILVSTIVLGVFMYIITIQKRQTFGIMKVQGISNFYIAKSVVVQTFLVSLTGVVIGLLLTIFSEILLPNKVPFKSNYIFYAMIAGLIVLISLIGAIFSVKGVTKVDPLEVLK